MSRAARASFTTRLRPTLGAAHLGKAPPDLLPLRDPAFCLREVCKQLVLLEDHLLQPRRRCADCIGKHCLMAEAFAEEATTLAEQTPVPEAERAAESIRALWIDLRTGKVKPEDAGQRVRTLRKELYASLPDP